MKSLLDLYASYNVWANKKIIDTILLLEDSKTKQVLISSFPSVHATVVHMYNAETIWYNRVYGTTFGVDRAEHADCTTREIAELLIQRSVSWEKITLESTQDDLGKRITYKTMYGQEFTQPVYEIILHLYNHSTYHRGQLITMMRNLGETRMPKTDLIDYARQ